MATNNSNNQDFSNDTDGFTLGGGTTERKLSITGADVTITGSGTAEITLPSADTTLVGRDTTDTLTNKTIDGDDNTFSNVPTSSLNVSTVSWVEATLEDSWVNYGTPYPNAGYLVDAVGIVHLRGLIKSGTTTRGTILFTLPSGYRPSADYHFICSSNNDAVDIDVKNTGDVKIGGSNASSSWLSLENISFPIF